MTEEFSSFDKMKTRTLISYAKRYLGLKIRDPSSQSVRSLTFEEGIDKLAKALNAIKYVYTTESCGGHKEGEPGPSGVSNPPNVSGAVWLKYAPHFMEKACSILREKELSSIQLSFSSPTRKRNYLWFTISIMGSNPSTDSQLRNMRKNIDRLATEIAKLAYEDPDHIWCGLLLRCNKKEKIVN